jgi:hypothetical protein
LYTCPLRCATNPEEGCGKEAERTEERGTTMATTLSLSSPLFLAAPPKGTDLQELLLSHCHPCVARLPTILKVIASAWFGWTGLGVFGPVILGAWCPSEIKLDV